MSAETWRPVVGASKYEVSDHGRVRSIARRPARVLKPTPNWQGYPRVHLSLDSGARRVMRVHRLVLIAFTGPPPPGQVARHLDGDPQNNRLRNLQWGTQAENEIDKIRHGSCLNANKTHCPQGHPYDADNTYVLQHGRSAWRYCRTCRHQRSLTRSLVAADPSG